MSRASDVQHFIDQLRGARTPKGVEKLLHDAAREMGFDNITMYHHVDLSNISPSYRHMSAGELIGITTCATSWSEHYRDNNLVATDPRVLASRRTAAPFRSAEVDRFIEVTSAQRNVVERQRRANIGEGFTIPAHFPGEPSGSCTFSMVQGRALPMANLGMASWIGMSAFQAAREMLARARRKRRTREVPRLTERQLQCTMLVGRGHCEGEIASQLGIAAETVKRHLKDARAAYGVHKSMELVTRALHDGQFTIADVISATAPRMD